MRNKYPGYCFICGKHVPADRGHFQRMSGRWKVRCKGCTGKGNEPVTMSIYEPPPPSFTSQSVCHEIWMERVRQMDEECRSHAHDDMHENGELAEAAAAYAMSASGLNWDADHLWPWGGGFVPKGPRRDLVRAAALIVAEIERLDRAKEDT